MRNWTRSLLMVGILSAQGAAAEQSPVYIVTPRDGATVKSPVSVIFGLRNPWGVAPAGVKMDNTGHHHLLVDTDVPDLKQPIPKDDQYRHFGGGQTETSLVLAPGKHTLQLLFGDFAHLPQTPALMSKKITITVK